MMTILNSVSNMKFLGFECPECESGIHPFGEKSRNFSCSRCGANLRTTGGVLAHICATVLFVVEAVLIFSINQNTWFAVVELSLLAVLNYLLSFKIFFRVVAADP